MIDLLCIGPRRTRRMHETHDGITMGLVNTSAKLFGLGSLVFGAWGLIDPESLTGVMGDDPDLGRLLGARDAVVGVALLTGGGSLALGLRLASDLHDAVRLRKRSPVVALGAAAIAVWGAVALARSLSADPE